MAQQVHNETLLQAELDALGIDALIARSGRNVAYLSGMTFPGTLGRLQDFTYAPRATLVVWPTVGEPTLIASAIAAGLAEERSWIEDIRVFREYLESPFAAAVRVLDDSSLSSGRVGIERRELGADHWLELQALLPNADLIDCTDLLESVRNIKTPVELERLKIAIEIQDEAHLKVFSEARPGDTERDLHARMVGRMIESGADSAHGMLQASTTPVTYGGEGDVAINPGVAVRTDYVSYYQGYAANLSRMAVMGPASTGQAERYATLVDVHRTTIDAVLRPGLSAEAVYDFGRARLIEARSTVVAGLIGHSVGVWWHQEEPMLVPGEKRLLRPGMVVCLEPILDGFWHLQDEILITDSDPEILSTKFDTSRLYEMG
jgi:Xaa-Pro aminopeptidase